jgi:hypothetical protein
VRRLREWWDELTFRIAESTGLPPVLGSVVMGLGGMLLLAILVAADAWLGGLPNFKAASDAASLNRSLGPGWRCSYVPQAESVCVRDTPAAPKP